MTSLFKKFFDLNQYNSSPSALAEIVSRLPYALYKPCTVTHVPLFSKSQEDSNFDRYVDFLRRNLKTIYAKPDDISEKNIMAITKAMDLIYGLTAPPASVIRKNDYNIIWEACNDAVIDLIEKDIAILVFEAENLLGSYINTFVHERIVTHHLEDIRESGRLLSYETIFTLTNATITVFISDLVENFRNISSFSEARKFEPIKFHHDQGKYGGLISWLKGHDKISENILGTDLEDRKIFSFSELKQNPTNTTRHVTDKYLLWRNGDQNWRYTFFDSAMKDKGDLNEIDDHELENFLRKILQSNLIEKSFPEIDVCEGSAYSFPGNRLGGAQYFLIPFELLLILANNFDDFCDHLRINVKRSGDSVRSVVGMTLDEVLDALSFHAGDNSTDFKDAISFSDDISMPELSGKMEQLRKLMIPLLSKTGDEGHSDSISSDPNAPKSSRIRYLIAAASEIFWKKVFQRDHYVIDHDDFILSSVIDGNAIYLSNFRPFEFHIKETDRDRIGFTRTFFVEFDLTPYQRGRLVRRLCDIATFRLAVVRDIDRIRAMQDGINTLNREFNQQVFFTNDDMVSDSTVDNGIRQNLKDTLALYLKTLRFNMYVTEGVTGRRVSAISDFDRVRKQVDDIRENRIHGYAMLRDFIERGIAISVSDIERLADRYENLRIRIRDHLSMIRTSLSGDQAEETTALMTKSSDLLEASKRLHEKIVRRSDHQVRLLSAADILIIIGGGYYVYSALKGVYGNFLSYLNLEKGSTVSELAILTFSFGTVYVVKRLVERRLQKRS